MSYNYLFKLIIIGDTGMLYYTINFYHNNKNKKE